jgi:hypothetical protein
MATLRRRRLSTQQNFTSSVKTDFHGTGVIDCVRLETAISNSTDKNGSATKVRQAILLFALCCSVILFEPFFAEVCAQITDPAASLPNIPISPKTIRDSKGKDFWLGFPRNHHDGNSTYDRLYINIVSERATQGKIEYTQAGRQRVQTFSVAANDIYTFELPYFDMELSQQGFMRNTFHITANEEVTVYGLSIANTTSDGFLAFPTDVLGREYIIASYPSNILYQNNGNPSIPALLRCRNLLWLQPTTAPL